MKYLRNILKAADISCAQTDSACPAANMLDDYPQNLWKATGDTATIHIDFGAERYSYPAYTLYTLNRNFTTMVFTCYNINGNQIGAPVSISMLYSNKIGGVIADTWRAWSPWGIPLDFLPANYDAVKMTADLYRYEELLYCGLMQIGEETELPGITNLKVAVKDHSIIKAMVSGSSYVKKRRSQRIYTCSFRDVIDQRYYAGYPMFHKHYIENIGAAPIIWKLTETDEYHMNVFACISGISYDYRRGGRYADVSFTLTEQI